MTTELSKYRADTVLREVSESIPVTIPIPIEQVIKTYLVDVLIFFRPFTNKLSDVSAFATKDMECGWLIVVNSAESKQRQRFSLAHELAHMVLMPNEPATMYCAQGNTNADEKLCDRFAGDILMPDAAVAAFYREHPLPYLETVAEWFDVSPWVAMIQLRRLKLPFKKVFGYNFYNLRTYAFG